ncbi:Nitrate and nitrite sensing [Streptomyces sp. YIM 130001]|uniref:sensor histidine kinase n=1 Tax=Streptomyces sp. YIM 130001 TaxID=2259644 RepID=UPI000E652D0A|nr:nitrate- and nitrite sensing domain-containing protein [Streptomyces sp. YIM 130001]RII13894.1 Nitrate and nitrite sensing [Streptomyces sp. YIM 130001]
MRITRRLILLVAVPLLVAVAFAARALMPATGQVVEAGRLTEMVQTAAQAGELTYHLQRERAAAAGLQASQGDPDQLQELVKATDESIARYQRHRDGLSQVPAASASALERIDRDLDELSSLRAQALSGSGALSAMAFGYRIVVADLIAYRDGIAQADGVPADVADHIRAAAALSKSREWVGQQQVTVARAMADGGFTPATQNSFGETELGYTESTAVVFSLGPSQWRTWLERTLAGPKAMAAQQLADEAARTTPGQKLDLSPSAWQKASSDRLALLRSVESRVDDDVLATVKSERTSQMWWAAGELAIIVLALVVAVLIAVRLGKEMVARLRHLRNAAHEVAHERLPREVTELAQPGALAGTNPDEIAAKTAKPLPAITDDEIGEVGDAFNAVHRAAVRLAAQQAEAHERFAETLVGVARRGAQLTTVMTNELSTVQREELDPSRMEVLFALDHLAIRMERNANNLLVLGGYGRGRVRTANQPCTSVIYAAAQQIERFSRVSLGHVDPTIGIAARAVDDIAHLLAELLDNATRFSAPDTQVGVAAWQLWDRAVVQIVDDGVGMSDGRRAELNAKLAAPQADIGGVRSMGVQVAARLAARHGIVVEMRASSGPGTIVEVTLPKEVLTTVPRYEPPAPSTRDEAGSAERTAEDEREAKPVVERARPAAVRGSISGRSRIGAALQPPSIQGPGGEPAREHGASAAEGGDAGRDRAPTPAAPATGPRIPTQPQVSGVSAAGLPVRKRRTPGDGTAPGRPQARPAAAARKAPTRRDSRQVSDVLAAYAQGISRSTDSRGASAAAASTSPDDTTQRST